MRRIAVAVFLGGGMGLAQSTLPATSPTAAPPASSAAAATKASPTAAQSGLPIAGQSWQPNTAQGGQPNTVQSGQPNTVQSGQPNTAQGGQQAQVTYSPGLLEVDADNSSLNQILGEISRRTGMKVSGGVADERVYGRYGPAAPAEVLASLLDGTNINMILRETASSAPKELILTPREGGPTPPDWSRATAVNPAPPVPQAAAPPPPNGEERPVDDGSARPPYPGVGGVGDGVAGGSGTDTSAPRPQLSGPRFGPSSGVQTSQQVYQQLQQMQQTQPASPQ